MHVFVVILNWNREADTVDCLKGIKEIPLKDFMLTAVVVDNNSRKESKDTIRQYIERNRDLDIRLIENDENLGFAAGNNVGINYAVENEADYVFILNNDAVIEKKAITNLISAAEANPNAGILTPKIYFAPGFEFHKDRYKENEIGRVIWSAGGVIDWSNVYGINRGVDEVDNGQYNDMTAVDFATGAAMFVHSDIFRQIGYFDERYFMYYEDADLSVRVKNLDKDIIFVPNAVVWHKVAQSSGIGSDLNDYFISRNRMLFGIQYATLRTKFALFKESIRFLIKGRKWQKKGIKDYYRGKFGKGSWVNEK